MSRSSAGVAVHGSNQATVAGQNPGPRALIIGPLPPPYQGMSIFTRQLLGSAELGGSYQVLHLDTADRRTAENMGRLDLTNITLALRHAAQLVKILVRHRPEIIYVEVSQNELAYLRDSVFIYLGAWSRGRVVAHLHGSLFREFYEGASWWCRWLIRSTSRRLAAAAVLGDGLRGIYDGLVPSDRVHSVPNGIVDPWPDGVPHRAQSAQAERPVADDVPADHVARDAAPRPITVLYLGMLFEPKGFLDLLRSALELGEDGPPLRFVFAGEWFSDHERRQAESVLAELDARDNDRSLEVTFVGRVDGREKWALYEEADIFVFPGYQPEGLPLVILEAMAAALPVITTDTGAIRDVVLEGETGLFIAKSDPSDLARAIRELAGSAELRSRLGEAGRARYLAEFTESQCTRRLVQLFDHVREGDRKVCG